jgi:hypothetical protein
MPDTLFQEDNWSHILSLPGGGVHFDGGTTLIGTLAMGPTSLLSVSYWYRLQSNQSAGTFWEIDHFDQQEDVEFFSGFDGNSPGINLNVYVEDTPPDPLPRLRFGASSNPAFGQWHHAAYSADTSAAVGVLFIDGVNVTSSGPDNLGGFLIAPHSTDFVLGGDGFGNNTVLDLAELWMGFGQLVDFNDLGTLRKFITADGAPVSLGANGELPTGIAPTIFGHGGAASFLQPNLGTGGVLSLAGVLTDASSAPHL